MGYRSRHRIASCGGEPVFVANDQPALRTGGDVTLFKNGGGGRLALMTASYHVERGSG